MLGKKITLLVLPQQGNHNVKTISIPRYLPLLAMVAAAVAICAMAAFSAFMYYRSLYASDGTEQFQVDRLRRITVKQDIQIKTFAEKIHQLEMEMARLRQYDRKLRTMTRKNVKLQAAVAGAGGSDGEVDTPKAMLKSNTALLVKQMHRDIDRLLAEAGVRELTQNELSEILQETRSIMAATPDSWPLRGPITSYFGYRSNPFSGRGSEFHRGLDISAPDGTPIVAPAEGRVVSVEWNSGYGLILEINHGYGLVTRYAHLAQCLVEKGERIKRGQKVALVGSTGRVTGPHLHYETILDGIPVNPIRYLEAKK